MRKLPLAAALVLCLTSAFACAIVVKHHVELTLDQNRGD